MKTYGQLCAVARALDLVGDRWTLLIVRELLILDHARFTDIQHGLPGVAPNLLAQRLRDLEGHGLVRRETAAPPATGSVYRLTDRGRDLDGVVRELLKWGAGTMADAPVDAAFRMHWLSMPARFLLHDARPGAPRVTIRFGDVRDGFDVTTGDGHGPAIGPCHPDVAPAAIVSGPGPLLVALIRGALPLAQAAAAGVQVTGDADALARVLPQGDPRSGGSATVTAADDLG